MDVCHCCMCSMVLYGSLYVPATGEIYSGYRYIDICSHSSCVKQFDINTKNYSILLGGLSNTPTNLCMALYCIIST